MIPLNLTLKGIYSYQQNQNIDFTRLTNANLFGIFGAVGSGKSTILEAISFALYGETERLNQKDNRNYNMMNLKSNELLIDYTFKTGSNDELYRFIVKGKRNGKQFDKVGTFERTALKKNGENWEPVSDNAENIIGLSYQNFRKTIIIPQNRFQEFLELGDSARTQMMKELFNLDKYELYEKVTSLESKNKINRSTIEARINQIGEVSPEQINAKELDHKRIESEITKNDKIYKEKQKAELEFKTLKTAFDKITNQTEKLAALKVDEANIFELENSIQEYEKCQTKFKAVLDNSKVLNKKITERADNIKTQIKQFDAIKLSISKSDAQFKLIKPKYDTRDSLLREAEEIEKIIKIQGASEEVEVLKGRIKDAEKFIKEKEDVEKSLVGKQKGLKNEIAICKKDRPDLNQLSEIKDWFTNKRNINTNIRDYSRDESDLLESNKKVERDLEKIMTGSIKKLIPDLSDEPDGIEYVKKLKSAKARINKEIDVLENRLQELATMGKLDEYAKKLSAGDPCPLCGSEDHPHVLDSSDVTKALKQANQTKKELQNTIEVIDNAIELLNDNNKELQSNTQSLTKIMDKLKNERANLDKHLKLFKWKKFSASDEAGVTKAFKDAEKLNTQIENLEASLEKIDKEFEKNSDIKRRAGEKLKGIRENLSAKDSTVSVLKGQLKILNLADYKAAKIDTLKAKMVGLKDTYKNLEKSYNEIDKELKHLRAEENKLKGGIDKEQSAQAEDEKTQKDLKSKITKLLKENGYDSLELVESILKLNLNIETERKKVATYRADVYACTERLKELKAEVSNKAYDKAKHEEIISEIATIGSLLDKLKSDKGSLATELNNLKENLKLRSDLQVQLNEVILREEDINKLKQLFKGSGFVNYISSVYLQNLCLAANERFHKLTRQKLKLEVTETNNFQIRDYLNDGQTRSVKTLSGGQTFQAALSLALALADNIQRLTQSKQNFFFLDEGFGSLDKETLQVVFETLKTLRKENRIVGVISHVEEMQQEIDTYLKVLNHEDIGSTITTTWN